MTILVAFVVVCILWELYRIGGIPHLEKFVDEAKDLQKQFDDGLITRQEKNERSLTLFKDKVGCTPIIVGMIILFTMFWLCFIPQFTIIAICFVAFSWIGSKIKAHFTKTNLKPMATLVNYVDIFVSLAYYSFILNKLTDGVILNNFTKLFGGV